MSGGGWAGSGCEGSSGDAAPTRHNPRDPSLASHSSPPPPSSLPPRSKSGLNFSTPAATFDNRDGPFPDGDNRPILQGTCSGEIGVNLLSGNLQASIHAPYLQDFVAFIAERIRVLQEARRVVRSNTVLSAAQYEFRYMIHHAAHW